MTPDEKPGIGPERSAGSEISQPVRGSRRPPGRGYRGRGRRPLGPLAAAGQSPRQERLPQKEPGGDVALEPLQAGAEPASRQAVAPPLPVRQPRASSPAGVQKAIEEVNRIIQTLKETLDDMEEVLETLEFAERQKNADEREIESMRRALRQLQRPREGEAPHPERRPAP